MTDRPILFSAPMVRALLAGTKTQTRRIVKPQPELGVRYQGPELGGHLFTRGHVYERIKCPYGAPGDRLWVREAHYLTDDGDCEQAIYAQDAGAVAAHLASVDEHERRWPSPVWPAHRKLRPSIHMPRWASRLTLTVTDVRVERLNDISEPDSIAEGARHFPCTGPHRGAGATYWSMDGRHPNAPIKRTEPVAAYEALWEEINGPDSWAANPWVWAVSFSVETAKS